MGAAVAVAESVIRLLIKNARNAEEKPGLCQYHGPQVRLQSKSIHVHVCKCKHSCTIKSRNSGRIREREKKIYIDLSCQRLLGERADSCVRRVGDMSLPEEKQAQQHECALSSFNLCPFDFSFGSRHNIHVTYLTTTYFM